MGIRCFLAFELPVSIRETLSRVLQDMKRSRLDLRWVKEENIHLTIVFLGDMSIDRIGEIQESVGKVCHVQGPFQISVTGPGVFPGKRNPRVLWLGLAGDLERMSRFRDDLQINLEPFGIKKENRPFSPHLTLGRFRDKARQDNLLDQTLVKYKDLTGPLCALNELVLFKSDLRPAGPIYSRLNAWPLTGA
jgi:RNA 2',3'-cyclic 3'-phosphodiesterase